MGTASGPAAKSPAGGRRRGSAEEASFYQQQVPLHAQDMEACDRLPGSETAEGLWKQLARAYQ